MTLKKREKILAAVTIVLVVWLGGRFLLGGSLPSISVNRAERDRLAAEVEKKKARIDAATVGAAQLAQWERRALPADIKLAATLYQNWLTKLAGQVQLEGIRVETGENRAVRNIYHLFSFTLRGHGTFDNLVRFLFEFYRAGHLHQIRHLTIKPLDDPKRLDLVIVIDALSLPGADRTDKLCDLPGTLLEHDNLADYQKEIVSRQLFSPYRPAPPPAPPVTRPSEPPKPPFDETKHIFLTAVVYDGAKAQAWITRRTTGDEFRPKQGEAFDIGPVHGKVLSIGVRDIEVEMAGRRYTIRCGDSFHDAKPVPGTEPEPKAQPAEKTVAEATVKPEAKPADGSETKPAETPEAKPAGTPETKPAEKPEAKPAEPAEPKPTDKPEAKPAEQAAAP